MHKPLCKKCGKELTIASIKRLMDVDGTRLGYYCNDCFHGEDQRIKNSRFIEEYNGNSIYMKDDKYYPYWECLYYFTSLEGAKVRIDNSHIAYIDPNMFRVLK